MLSIKENSIYTYEIKKSKFITLLYKINNVEEVDFYLKEVKKEYKDATHYCYAYKVNNSKKASDDGEPAGTAGLPILDVLDKKNLDNILCIVVRYFGGIKLGAGGLLRAYSTSVKEAIDNNEIIELKDGYLIEISFTYDNSKLIDTYLDNEIILNKEYNDNIVYKIIINKNNNELLDKLKYSTIKLNIIKEIIY